MASNTNQIFQSILRGVIEDDCPEEAGILGDHLPKQREENEVVDDVVNQIRRIAKDLQRDRLLQRSIANVSTKDEYLKIVSKVIEDDRTWENIILLLYTAGRIIVKTIKAHLPQLMLDILSCTKDFFQRNILDWVERQGGWVKCILYFSTPAVQYWAIFTFGILLGGFFMWRAGRCS